MMFWMVFALVLVVTALYALTAWAVMLLWNWIMPFLFGLPEIGFWMALGIYLMSTILIKGVSIEQNISKQFNKKK
jgi:hypothetical protein